MPSQVMSSAENNFTKGLITEATGLNFPENAATDCDNCTFTLIGDVTRRLGIDLEENGTSTISDRTNRSLSSYVWDNVGGDGQTKFLVVQNGVVLSFYNISAATDASPISTQLLSTTIALSSFLVAGSTFDLTLEATYADGNGYLFVFHPQCDPFYIVYNAGTLTANVIPIQIRDFAGIKDGLAPSVRPGTDSQEHLYNLLNQGWISGQPWDATDSSGTVYPLGALGPSSWTVASGIAGIVAGQLVSITYQGNAPGFNLPPGTPVASGTVTSYSGTSLHINITSVTSLYTGINFSGPWGFVPTSIGFINTFVTAANAYPSNSDVWWYFRDNTGTFNPGTTLVNTSLSSGNAPNAHYILNAFTQDRSSQSGVSGLTTVATALRPANGAWFQGRIFYTGVNANFFAAGDAYAYSWVENIYFSKTVQTVNDFGACYQVNDPTSDQLNNILPTDGGVITISGAGRIYKLFPIANGIIVFATNGVYFITGSQGIGFSADDYTITTLSNIQCISSTSFVNVMGLPYFWNEEGIYSVTPNQNGSLQVEPITVGTILSFYNNIPKLSKIYARGAYDPINYTIQWIYRTTLESDETSRYSFDGILNYNVFNKAFYPYTVSNTLHSCLNSIVYVTSPTASIDPSFKYLASSLSGAFFNIFIADEHDSTYTDWATYSATDYTSYFVTGYKVHGQGQRRFQLPYIYMFSRIEDPVKYAYYIQGIWDYATSFNGGRQTSSQYIEIYNLNQAVVFKRHRIRGNGLTLQIKVSSVTKQPFDIIGWSTFENVNQGV